jgi:predicted peptidase
MAPSFGIRHLDAFAARRFVDATGYELPYRLLLPAAGAPPGRYPLLLVLHGAGERGTDNVAQLANGIAEVLIEHRAAFPCIAVIPQCPPGRRWVEVDWSASHHEQPPVPSVPMHAVLALLDEIGRELGGDGAGGLAGESPRGQRAPFLVDAERVYALGLSMGGYGVWDALFRQPQRFAAAVPICGGAPGPAAEPDVSSADWSGQSPTRALCGVAIWAFHGALDPVVPVERSRRIIAALRRDCPGALRSELRYTEYAEVGHNAWTHALGEPALWPWLFAQRRKLVAPAAAGSIVAKGAPY